MMVFQVNGVAVLPPDLARPEKVKRMKMTKVMAVNMAVERNFGSSNSSVPVNPQPTSTKRQLAVSTT